jgi:hypothetical protein
MDEDITDVLKETIGRLLHSLREVVDEGHEILENLQKVNVMFV